MKKILLVEGMTWGHCKSTVEAVLGALDGVTKVEVDLSSKTVVVEGENLDDILMKEEVEDAGYEIIEIR